MNTHPVRAPRVALLHTWLTTQTEGWWRQAFDNAQVPYTYINTQQVAKDDNLNAKFDVIVFPPVGRGTEAIVNGMPMWGNPLPWKKTAETPNLGSEDQTDDMRPGLGWTGVAHLQTFVRNGGLLLTVMDTADLAVSTGFTPGLSVAQRQRMRIVGSVVRSKMVDATSPIAYGYTDNLAIWCDNGPIFNVSSMFGGRGGRRLGPDDGGNRPTGRGTADDPTRRRAGRASRFRRSRRSTRGRPCRSPTNSCATGSTSSRPTRGRASSFATPIRATCSSRASSRTAAKSRSTRRWSTCRSTRVTSSRFRTTRSGAARRKAATSWCSTRC